MCYLFDLILNSGLRISEALRVKVRDVRLTDGVARSVRVIGKGNKERLVPLPEAFGQVFGIRRQMVMTGRAAAGFEVARMDGDHLIVVGDAHGSRGDL